MPEDVAREVLGEVEHGPREPSETTGEIAAATVPRRGCCAHETPPVSNRFKRRRGGNPEPTVPVSLRYPRLQANPAFAGLVTTSLLRLGAEAETRAQQLVCELPFRDAFFSSP